MNSFIKKLVKEEKIKITDSSREISSSYLLKSQKSLISSKTLLKIENFDDATALIYYSMYYSALVILYKIGIKCENHLGTIILIKELFGIESSVLQKAKSERVDKQYYVDSNATKEEVKEGIMLAEEFNSKIKQKIDTIKDAELKVILKYFKEEYF